MLHAGLVTAATVLNRDAEMFMLLCTCEIHVSGHHRSIEVNPKPYLGYLWCAYLV